ncbi:MAG: tetratricopeptide repeat protein [Armatimonadetes bacterium]|nr:tetratricopeptide repeat protein [Armatimonadota bacterium]
MDPLVQTRLDEANQARIALDYDRAKVLYEAVLDALPNSAAGKHGLGFVLMMGYGEFDAGLGMMEEAAKLAPDNQRIILDLAKSYAMLGEDDKVKPLLERVVGLDPSTREGQDARNQLQYYP